MALHISMRFRQLVAQALATLFSLLAISLALQATAVSAAPGGESGVLGLWQAIDESSRQPTALIRLEWHGERQSRTMRGRVERVLPADPNRVAATCQNCSGERHGKPIEGMDILWDLTPQDKEMSSFAGGTVLDPSSGKTYRCGLRLRSDGQLEVRGFIGLPMFGRTQVWRRAPGSAEPASGPGPKVNAPGTPLVP